MRDELHASSEDEGSSKKVRKCGECGQRNDGFRWETGLGLGDPAGFDNGAAEKAGAKVKARRSVRSVRVVNVMCMGVAEMVIRVLQSLAAGSTSRWACVWCVWL